MQIAKYESLPWTRAMGARGDVAEYRRMFCGTPGQTGNFEFCIYRNVSAYYTPRHRHNFDQVRFTFIGLTNYAPGHDIPERSIGYFPEGTYYGPQENRAGVEWVLLQYEGGSRSGFIDFETMRSARQELAKRGRFTEKGVYTWVDANGTTHNRDGHQAVWEHAAGRKEEYPEPRYAEPVVLHPQNFRWVGCGSAAKRKALGLLGEVPTELEILQVEAGEYAIESRDRVTLALVISGDGTAAGQALQERDAFRTDSGEGVTLTSRGRMELLMIGMPKLI